MKLHITNGDCAGNMLKRSSLIEGDVFCWRDVLHDGPIIAVEGDQYHNERASYLWSVLTALNKFHGTEAEIVQLYKQRQQLLTNLAKYEEIVLWFQHSLFDQLQLAECLYHLAKTDDICRKTTFICIAEHAELPFFQGLGNLSAAQIEALYADRKKLLGGQLKEACLVWSALAKNKVDDLQYLVNKTFSYLPFMQRALRRFAQEYPSVENGLTRSQQYILESIANPLQELPVLRENLKLREKWGLPGAEKTVEECYAKIMNKQNMSIHRLYSNMLSIDDAPFFSET